MLTTAAEFRQRTKQFALRVIRLVESLPQRRTADVIGKQFIRSGTSVGANYRAACRARSPQEFRAKLGIVEEEADESIYWIELLVESNLVRESLVNHLLREADEILAMVVASIKTSSKTSHRRTPGLPFLSGSKEPPEAHHQFLDLVDGVQDDLCCPVDVQDQPGPQAVRPLQPIRPSQDHSGLVVQPFDWPTCLPGCKVIQDLLLPPLEGCDEAFQLRGVVQHVQEQSDQRSIRLVPIPGRVKDLLEP